MCAGFHLEKNTDEFDDIVKEAGKSPLADRFRIKSSKPMVCFGEVRPTDIVPVIAPDRYGKRAVFPMKWGFTLPGSKQPLINARLETAPTKPTFKEAWDRRRCIIPASWYYEWSHYKTADGKTKTGDKYMIQPAGSSVTRLCGLYRIEDNLPVFTRLTKDPTEELLKIHDRMPLILPEAVISDWINPEIRPDALLEYALTDMVIEKAD